MKTLAYWKGRKLDAKEAQDRSINPRNKVEFARCVDFAQKKIDQLEGAVFVKGTL